MIKKEHPSLHITPTRKEMEKKGERELFIFERIVYCLLGYNGICSVELYNIHTIQKI